MSGHGTPALVALAAAGVPHTVHAYHHDAAGTFGRGSGRSFGEEAATALNISTTQVFKTLVAEVDGSLVVAVVPVAGSLDLKRLAAAVGGKRAAMAEVAAAERATGYVVGGISPLGQRRQLPTVVDDSALGYPTIFVSAGRRGLDVEIAAADLVALTGATVGPIAKI